VRVYMKNNPDKFEISPRYDLGFFEDGRHNNNNNNNMMNGDMGSVPDSKCILCRQTDRIW